MDRDIQDLIDLYGIHDSPVLDTKPDCDQTKTDQHILNTDIPLYTPHLEDNALDLPSLLLPFTPDITRVFSFDIQDIIAAEENSASESNSSITTQPALTSEDSTLISTQFSPIPEAAEEDQELLPPAPPQTPVDKPQSATTAFSGPSHQDKQPSWRRSNHYHPQPILPKFRQNRALRLTSLPIPVRAYFLDLKYVPLLKLQVQPTQQFALTNPQTVPFKKRCRFNWC